MRRRLCLASLLAPLCTACGFQLRQAPQLAFDSVAVAAPAGSPVADALQRALVQTGRVRVITDPAQRAQAQVVLELVGEQREKVVVGLSASGQVREFQLRLRIRFRLRTPAGREVLPDTELVQQRDISFSESVALAKEAEEVLLYRDMQADLVQQVLRRLAAVGG